MIKISGKIIRGQGYGKVLGFPTANLDRRQYVRQGMKIKFGVYAGWAEIEGSLLGRPQKAAFRGKYPAAIVIGPLDKHRLPKIEAHLVGFKGNLYGIYINIYLNIYLRPFKKFKSEQGLRKQINKDIKNLLNN